MKDRFKEARKVLGLTQDEIADQMSCSRGVVANIEGGRAAPNAMFIAAFCSRYNVNETWLKTGEGDMFRSISRDEEVTEFFMSILAGDDSFKKAFITALSQVDDNGWKLIKDFAAKLYEEQKKDRG